MTCREAAGFLMDYLEGDLPPDVRASFDFHLDECENCRAYLATYEAAVRMAQAALAKPEADASTALPGDLVSAILASIRKSETT